VRYADVNGNEVDLDSAIASTIQSMMLGSYSKEVQNLQILLYAEGYDISGIDGLFDAETCQAVQEYQRDKEIPVAESTPCKISVKTLQALNETIGGKGYLGSGFNRNPQGFLEGVGSTKGLFGPGVIDYTQSAEASEALNEGDVVLMYMFLDEETILITRTQAVIEEIIKRRALKNIFK
jgi:hypothetical protein